MTATPFSLDEARQLEVQSLDSKVVVSAARLKATVQALTEAEEQLAELVRMADMARAAGVEITLHKSGSGHTVTNVRALIAETHAKAAVQLVEASHAVPGTEVAAQSLKMAESHKQLTSMHEALEKSTAALWEYFNASARAAKTTPLFEDPSKPLEEQTKLVLEAERDGIEKARRAADLFANHLVVLTTLRERIMLSRLDAAEKERKEEGEP